jgi:hypothetical protein
LQQALLLRLESACRPCRSCFWPCPNWSSECAAEGYPFCSVGPLSARRAALSHATKGARDHCPAAPFKRHAACLQVCLEAIEAALRAASAPPAFVAPTPVAQGPAPPTFRAPDPLARALRACVADVVESGAKTAVCHFDRPLDEMGFGQRHCDELCARATGLPSP